MSEVKRYALRLYNDCGGYSPDMVAPGSLPNPGSRPEYVLATDYDTALSQLAALREELAKVTGERDRLRNGVESDMAEIDRIQSVYDAKFVQCRKLRKSLADAERRNADCAAKLELAASMMDEDERGNRFAEVCRLAIAALNKPEEAKS